jgi:hypothetical protein
VLDADALAYLTAVFEAAARAFITGIVEEGVVAFLPGVGLDGFFIQYEATKRCFKLIEMGS